MKEASLKSHHSIIISTIWHSGKVKTMKTIKRLVVVRIHRGCTPRIFRASKRFCMKLQWRSICHLSESIECTTTNMNPHVNMDFGWWWFISVVSSNITVVCDVHSGVRYACVEVRCHVGIFFIFYSVLPRTCNCSKTKIFNFKKNAFPRIPKNWNPKSILIKNIIF